MADVRSQLRRFEGALSRLRPAKAEVVYLHDVLGHDLAEVAAAVGTSVAAAQSRLIRGRREIIDRMGSGARRAKRAADPSVAEDPEDPEDPPARYPLSAVPASPRATTARSTS